MPRPGAAQPNRRSLSSAVLVQRARLDQDLSAGCHREWSGPRGASTIPCPEALFRAQRSNGSRSFRAHLIDAHRIGAHRIHSHRIDSHSLPSHRIHSPPPPPPGSPPARSPPPGSPPTRSTPTGSALTGSAPPGSTPTGSSVNRSFYPAVTVTFSCPATRPSVRIL